MNYLRAIKVLEIQLLNLTASSLRGESKHQNWMIKMLIRLKTEWKQEKMKEKKRIQMKIKN